MAISETRQGFVFRAGTESFDGTFQKPGDHRGIEKIRVNHGYSLHEIKTVEAITQGEPGRVVTVFIPK